MSLLVFTPTPVAVCYTETFAHYLTLNFRHYLCCRAAVLPCCRAAVLPGRAFLANGPGPGNSHVFTVPLETVCDHYRVQALACGIFRPVGIDASQVFFGPPREPWHTVRTLAKSETWATEAGPSGSVVTLHGPKA